MSIRIHRLTSLPDDLAVLADLARAEGSLMVDRLMECFESGSNRFDSQGEALFGAEQAGILVGIGGLNVDPYFSDPTLGRVRHLYIHPRARRAGVGRQVIQAIGNLGRGHFSQLQLFTPGESAGRFYVALGFEVIRGRHKVSHSKVLGSL